jgi:hypothetical protein
MPRLIAMPLALLPIALLLASQPSTASAQSGTPDSENGRFSLTPIDDGFLRLDQRTGRVSICSRRALGWSCHPVPDERAALEEEIARLQRDNAALKKDMLTRGITPPGAPATQAPTTQAPTAQPPAPADKPALKVPSDAELDRAMAVMERLWKRLVEMVQRWQREMTPI